MKLQDYIQNVPNFPKQGINFKDISPLLANPHAFKHVIDKMADLASQADIIVAPDARGFIFGTPVAYAINKPFVMVRKKGKLPGKTIVQNYDLEYGENAIEIQSNVLKPNLKAVIIDDVLATGGTVDAIVKLLQSQQIETTKLIVLCELKELNGRAKLNNLTIEALIEE
ncbi:adenine phosphoribosyltransferase [Mycoplasma nasistruthionis]|uniref:Adenine phosphoribosyltransferase n=1 Tax=Mycoplasma nasistruthionis TaxID=353852 RepID=A0A4Y6I5X4_9MOLU|nr:adenine phosphoribosyltransferase [Mycoplasma nasistruthionis]QCZ36444.1 adenine phosphoribosyltransferase [Mycoplasma nasistruthionis]QDF64742.1 adenine phosphoribosyltransferase [Mycoplasma nasistruthionis]